MNNTPELRMDIPLDHPWAQAIIYANTREPNPWPHATMTFADTECLVQLCGVGGIVYGHGLHPDFLQTTWRAYVSQPAQHTSESTVYYDCSNDPVYPGTADDLIDEMDKHHHFDVVVRDIKGDK